MFGSIYHQVFKEVEGQFWINQVIKNKYWKQLKIEDTDVYQLSIKQNRKSLDRAKKKYKINTNQDIFLKRLYDFIKKGYLNYVSLLTPAELAKLQDSSAKTVNPFKKSQIIHNIRTKLAKENLISFFTIQTLKDVFKKKQKKYVPLRG